MSFFNQTFDPPLDYDRYVAEQDAALARGIFTASIDDIFDKTIMHRGHEFELVANADLLKEGPDGEIEITAFELKQVSIIIDNDICLQINPDSLKYNEGRNLMKELCDIAEAEALRQAKLFDDEKWNYEDSYF